MAKLYSNRTIIGNKVQVGIENEKSTVTDSCTCMCSHSPQNLEFGNFTLFGLVQSRNDGTKFISNACGGGGGGAFVFLIKSYCLDILVATAVVAS